jgi:hypothetical protein
MRRLIPAVVLMLAAGLAVAQEPQRPAAEPGQAQGKKEMTAIVVSADPDVKTITVRKEGAGRTRPRRPSPWPERPWLVSAPSRRARR